MHNATQALRCVAVRSIWVVADTLDVVRGGLIVLASKVIGSPVGS